MSKFLTSKKFVPLETKEEKEMNLPSVESEEEEPESVESVESEQEPENYSDEEEISEFEENENESETEPPTSAATTTEETATTVETETTTIPETTEEAPRAPLLIKMKESDKVKHHIQDFANWMKMLCDLINEPIEMEKIKNSIQEGADICMNFVDKVVGNPSAPRTSV